MNQQDFFLKGDGFHGYVIERLLGKGGLGSVYLVRHELLDTLCALKVLDPKVAKENPSYIKRFLREAKLATRIRHPNLVAVHDCGFDSDKGLYYIVMDYVTGGDLRQAIAFSGKIGPERAVKIVAQVASALEAARPFNVVHRDIKPENIMLQPDGTVKLVDLGIAKASNVDESLRTTTDSVFGTPTYVSPEQALSAADVDARADIYSLGIVLFEMLCGRTPYDGKTAPQVLAQVMSDDPVPDVRDFNGDVPPLLAVLVRRMCVKERERRIPNPAALLAELVKLGYDLGSTVGLPRVEYTPTPASEKVDAGLGVDLDKLPKKADNTLSFETKDAEIQTFISKLKRKRLVKRLTAAAVIIILLLVLLLTLVV